MTDVLDHNRRVWNKQSLSGENRWCQPVDRNTIRRAREGTWDVILTPNICVPRAWFNDVRGKDVLCLASGGGQQAPVLAAAGARVTSYDNSEEQLALDAQVAQREGLEIKTIRGDMANLAALDSERFDLVFHPVSNVFAEAVRPVWKECYRVLRKSGRLLAGFMNPAFFLFDHDALAAGGAPVVVNRLPYADIRDLDPEQLELRRGRVEAFEFSHSLDDQIGGQLDAGFIIAGYYEDTWDDEATPLNKYMPTSMATLALKQSVSG